MTRADLTEYEMRVLREIAGEAQTDIHPSAALRAALETLKRRGYVRFGKDWFSITEAGRALLAKETDR